ncbi:MAG: glycosyltransferase family 4 protein [Anaerolineae bacterium]|nr:glycosyltransferase family 4 protein [Anaerolineae bacterium]
MFEYMATGKPIVSSDHAVLQEVLQEGRNALLVPPADIDAWEAAVRRILDDPALGKRLGETAQRDLIEQYTWDARAHKVLDGIAEKIGA